MDAQQTVKTRHDLAEVGDVTMCFPDGTEVPTDAVPSDVAVGDVIELDKEYLVREVRHRYSSVATGLEFVGTFVSLKCR